MLTLSSGVAAGPGRSRTTRSTSCSALPAHRDLVDLQPVGRGHTGRDLAYALERGHPASADSYGGPPRLGDGETPPLNKRVGKRPTLVYPDFDRTLHFSTRTRATGRMPAAARSRGSGRRDGVAEAAPTAGSLQARSGPRDQVVAAGADNLDVQEFARRDRSRGRTRSDRPCGSISGAWPCEAAANDQLVLGRRAVDDQPRPFADARLLSLRDDLLLPRHQPRSAAAS